MMNLSPQKRKLVSTLLITLFILSAFVLSGFTVANFDSTVDRTLPPNQGGGMVDVILNGGFEERDDNVNNGIALNWEPYSNGQAWFGWYDETWEEAVRTGDHAQMMEIFQVEANILDRVMAIYQTVDVPANSTCNLTLYAIMRSQAPAIDRNQNEFEMHWGIDFTGEGNYDNVETWNLMPLEEQYRLGSTGQYPEDIPLFYETVTGTVQTGDSSRITLFIRGLKKFPTGTEVNFDVDDVSLMCPQGGVQVTTAPALVPTTGFTAPKNVSGGALVISGLVLVVLGTSAAVSLLMRKDRR
jgi:hypothetical protein